MKNIKRYLYSIGLFCAITLAAISTTQAQELGTPLIGHQEFFKYYNPSVAGTGEYASATLLHRNQWEGIGPKTNILYVNRPFLPSEKNIHLQSVGLVLQNEDYSQITKNGIGASLSAALINSKNHLLSIGVNSGVSLQRVKLEGLDEIELLDPSISQDNRQMAIINRLGLTYQFNLIQVGTAIGLEDFERQTDLHSFIRRPIDLPNPSWVVIPTLIHRNYSESSSQLEGQVRFSYNQMIHFTAGYRQNFGFIFQIGISLSKKYRARGSYGYEAPNGDRNELGSTSEFLLGYDWETMASKRRKRELAEKAKRDSIRMAKRDSVRQLRKKLLAEREAVRDSIENARNVADTTVVESEDDLISMDDVTLFHKPIQDSTHLILNHIRFEQGQDIIEPNSFHEIEKITRFLKHHHHFRIEVQGHSDNVGKFDDNIDLSERRATAVSNYILSRGIPKERIDMKGYGPTRPIAPNNSEEGRKKNRRVEIVFYQIK